MIFETSDLPVVCSDDLLFMSSTPLNMSSHTHASFSVTYNIRKGRYVSLFFFFFVVKSAFFFLFLYVSLHTHTRNNIRIYFRVTRFVIAREQAEKQFRSYDTAHTHTHEENDFLFNPVTRVNVFTDDFGCRKPLAAFFPLLFAVSHNRKLYTTRNCFWSGELECECIRVPFEGCGKVWRLVQIDFQ